MSHPLTVELSDTAYAALQLRARAAAQSPAATAAAALEQHFGAFDESRVSQRPITEAEKKAARERFERHFGEVNLGHATGTDNEGIDADLARAYADSHEEG
jgi:predicted transcriptional regulator